MRWTDDSPAADVRFVVLDTETTGLDPRRDRIITIGAVAVVAGEIRLDDSFEAMLPVEHNLASVTVHGVTRDQARDGVPEPEAVAAFLEYLGDGVIVGHHIGHDVAMLDAASRRSGGAGLSNRSLDTMDLALHLYRSSFQSFTLDALCEAFGVAPRDRHTAGGDAFITAQVFLRLLRGAARAGRTTLGEIAAPYVE